MKSQLFHLNRIAFAILLALFLFTSSALAGPPLICHSFDIGDAKSIPWTSHDWNLTGSENYNTKNLAADTIAILDSDSAVLVHMETLRRATLYARKDPVAAKQLRHQTGRSRRLFRQFKSRSDGLIRPGLSRGMLQAVDG